MSRLNGPRQNAISGTSATSLVADQELEMFVRGDRPSGLLQCRWVVKMEGLRQLDNAPVREVRQHPMPESLELRPYIAEVASTAQIDGPLRNRLGQSFGVIVSDRTGVGWRERESGVEIVERP